MFITTMNLFFKVFFMIGLGFFAKKFKVLTNSDQKSMTTILLKIVVYFLIIMSSQDEFSLDVVEAIKISGITAILFYLAGIPILIEIASRFELSESKQRVFVSSIIFFNVTFLGYPLMEEIFGTIGLLSAIMFSMVYNIIFYSWGMTYLSGESKKVNIKAILSNKISIVSIVALIMYFIQIKIPEPLFGVFHLISSLSFPISMLIIGCNLGDIDLTKIITDKEVYPITILRMVISPLIVFIILTLMKIDLMIVNIITLILALPGGFMTVIVSTDFDCAPDFASKALIQTMLAMCITFPLWQFIISIING